MDSVRQRQIIISPGKGTLRPTLEPGTANVLAFQPVLIFPLNSLQFSSVQSLSRVRLFATLWIAACQASLSITNSRSSPKLMSIQPSSHPAISSSVVPFSSCPQSLPALESFPMSQLFAWGGQSTGVSALADTLNSSLSSILYIQSTSNSYWFYLQTYTEICPHHSTSTA